MLIIGQIYFWLPGEFVCDMASSDWSTVVSKASWHCIVLLGQLAWSTHFTLHCPMSWMLSDFFIHFHFGGVKEQVDFSLLDYHLTLFYTEMSVFSCESCQCVGNYGFWNVRHVGDLNVFTDYLCIEFECRLSLLLFRNVHSVSGF